MGLNDSNKTVAISEKNADKVELDPEKLDEDDRGTWSNQCEFFLSCLGYAVGFGNVWRFPYLCYENGGAVFLIPYVIMLFCAGLPLFFMELAIGQYVSLGPNVLFPKIAKIVSGLGWAMVAVSGMVAIYYNMILAWTIHYTFASFTSVLPWSHCENDFNSIGCFTSEESLACETNGTIFYNKTCETAEILCNGFNLHAYNETWCLNDSTTDEANKYLSIDSVADRISASEDYYKNRVLGLTGRTWEDMGPFQWELVGSLGLAWVIVYFCMIRGVKSSGKVVYFTALFPYAVLLILFVRGLTLDGAYDGIEFYFLKPNITKLYEIKVWKDAATQIFYSLGSSFGGLITLASYNKFKNNCMRDAIVISFCNCATSVFSGFVIFSILGFMAKTLHKPVSAVVTQSAGLAFIAYPAAVTKMPLSPLWAILFFVMLITLGLDSQFTMVETLATAVFDRFEFLRPKKALVVALMCFVLFCCGLTFCLGGGIHMFTLFDNYCAGLSLVIIAIIEVIAIHHIYGFKRFMKNIREDMGIKMNGFMYCYWSIMWLFITPLCLLMILVMSIYYWGPASYQGYLYPGYIQFLMYIVTFCSVSLIPIFAGYHYYKNDKKGNDFKELFKTHDDVCPASERRLRALKGAAGKGKPSGIYRYVKENEGFDDTLRVAQNVRVTNGSRPSSENQYSNNYHM